MTDTCENITFQQLRWLAVKMKRLIFEDADLCEGMRWYEDKQHLTFPYLKLIRIGYLQHTTNEFFTNIQNGQCRHMRLYYLKTKKLGNGNSSIRLGHKDAENLEILGKLEIPF